MTNLSVQPGVVWGVLPARGGSKSVPMKNLALLAGRPLIDYNILAARASRCIARLICSTDSDAIAAYCEGKNVEVHRRPERLAGDDAPVYDAIQHLIEDLNEREGSIAEFVALLQPTSPFTLPMHIEQCVDALRRSPDAGSAQTIIPCPHNHHALNQRVVRDGVVSFRFAEERKIAYNKQRKPEHYVFGNLVIVRAVCALKQKTLFASPSLPILVPSAYGFDVDGPDDFRLGMLLVDHQLVDLPFIK